MEELYRSLYSKYASNLSESEVQGKIQYALQQNPTEFINAFYKKYTGSGPTKDQIDYINSYIRTSALSKQAATKEPSFALGDLGGETSEENTWLENNLGKNILTDYFGDIWRAGQQGIDQGSTVGEAFDIYRKGKDISEKDLQKFIEVNKRLEAQGPSDEMREYERIKNEAGGGVWGFMKAMALTRGQIIPQVLVSSIANMGATFFDSKEAVISSLGTAAASGYIGAKISAAAGSVAGPLGTAIGAFGGGVSGAVGGFFAGLTGAMETGLTLTELLKEKLGDKEFNEKNVRAILEDEEAFDDIKSKALARGVTIAAIERIGFAAGRGVGAKMLKKGVGKQKIARAVAGTEALTGSVGEAAGQLAAGQDFDIAEVLLEGIVETKGVANVSDILATRKYTLNNRDISKKELKAIIDKHKDKPELLSRFNIKVEGDKNFENYVKLKKGDAFLYTQINSKVSDPADRSRLVELEKQKRSAEKASEKKGIFKDPDADLNLEDINKEIDNIINKYAGVDGRTKEVRAREKVAKEARETFISDTIAFAEASGKLVGKEVKVVDNDAEAQKTYDAIIEEYNKTVTDPADRIKAKNVKGSDGFIIGDSIIINKDIAGRTGQINVGAHEILHGIINKHYKSLFVRDSKGNIIDDSKAREFIGDFKNTISKKSRQKVLDVINARNEQARKEGGDILDENITDEWLTIYSDLLKKNQISFDENVYVKFRNFLHNIFRTFNYKKEFGSGIATYNFMRDYQKSIEAGVITQRAVDVAGGGTTVTEVKKSVSPERRQQISDNVKEIGNTYSFEGGKTAWDQGGADNAITEIKEGKFLDDLIAAKYKGDRVPVDFVSKVYSELTNHIRNFNPETNDNLFGWINSQLANKAGNVFNREYKRTEQETTARDVR
tara:strand:- start:642 stop:3326 length:2685 start_codon:yes stop_codon:yes gene_type:complete